MSDVLRYSASLSSGAALALAAPQGAVTWVRVPDPQARARFIAAVAKARCDGEGEALELFGEPVAGLRDAARTRLLRRVGVVSPAVSLIASLNAWENISLPAEYHGSPARERVAELAREVLGAFVEDPVALLGRLPDQLTPLERRVVCLARLLVVGPELAVLDGLREGLSPEECACVPRFEEEYLARHPSGSVLIVDTMEKPS